MAERKRTCGWMSVNPSTAWPSCSHGSTAKWCAKSSKIRIWFCDIPNSIIPSNGRHPGNLRISMPALQCTAEERASTVNENLETGTFPSLSYVMELTRLRDIRLPRIVPRVRHGSRHTDESPAKKKQKLHTPITKKIINLMDVGRTGTQGQQRRSRLYLTNTLGPFLQLKLQSSELELRPARPLRTRLSRAGLCGGGS